MPADVAKVEVVDAAGAVLADAEAKDGWFLLTLDAGKASGAVSLVAQSASPDPLTGPQWAAFASSAGIDSASAARPGAAGKGSAKYWVSCVTRPSRISMTLTE